MGESRFITNQNSRAFDAERVPFVEPIAVLDTYVSGFRIPEAIGDDIYRLTTYIRQTNVHDGSHEFVINGRLLLSVPTLATLGMMLPGAPSRGRQ